MSSEDITIVLMLTILFSFLAFVIWIKRQKDESDGIGDKEGCYCNRVVANMHKVKENDKCEHWEEGQG